MLVLCPNNRITAEDALKHPYFTNYKITQETPYRKRVQEQYNLRLEEHIHKK
jgi:hypothetical protein